MSTNAPAPVFPPAVSMDILFTKEQIAARVREIGEQISTEYAGQDSGQPIVLIGVLKGAAIFLADLARAITISNTFRLRRRPQATVVPASPPAPSSSSRISTTRSRASTSLSSRTFSTLLA